MTALSNTAEPCEVEDAKRYNDATAPMRGLLGELKDMASKAGNRYFVTGIVPVALRESVFNGYMSLTFDLGFAGLCGFTEDEVRLALIHVARIEEGSDELERALAVARKCFNGHYFVGFEEALYNPQLVLQFAQEYDNRFKGELLQDDAIASRLGELTDWNQVPSQRQVQLLQRDPDIASSLLLASKGRPVEADALEAPLDAKALLAKPLSLLFFVGVLTLDKDQKHADGKTRFRLPNAVTKFAYVDMYRNTVLGLPSSSSRFFREPSVQHLEELLKRVAAKVDTGRSLKENEALLRGLLSSELLFSLKPLGEQEVFVDVEMRPATDSLQRMDIAIRTPRHVIVIELKRVPRRVLRSESALSISDKEPDVPRNVLEAARTDKRRQGRTVHQFQAEAVAQARGYMEKQDPDGRQLVGFAVTQVAEYFLIDEVSCAAPVV
eukprot:1560658-Rhodomonas_salina.3